MGDMLVRLYALGEPPPLARGLLVRRALAPERRPVIGWIEQRFGAGWAGECDTTLSATPTRCLLALEAGAIVGFAAWDAVARGFFGPIGVDPDRRANGVGAALLRGVLAAMRAEGYGYAIIGNAGTPEFFSRVAGATPIPESSPGIYAGLLR